MHKRHESGSKKRKIAQEKKPKEEKVLKKVPKISDFLIVSSSNQSAPSDAEIASSSTVTSTETSTSLPTSAAECEEELHFDQQKRFQNFQMMLLSGVWSQMKIICVHTGRNTVFLDFNNNYLIFTSFT